ncbi:hypothetical protein SDC9_177215 [bioreactor metagenome]|uniref:Uncharacterized protein n=1 Tax=bioreactor metagenome TaxID=1076179 RepID=A0A645GUU6_9ZZZZ
MDTLQLGEDDADGVGAWGRFKPGQFFQSQTVGEVVAHGVQVIHAVGHDLGLLVGFGFHVLFNAGV